MSDENKGDNEVFDVDKVRELILLMKEHDLSEVDLQNSPRRIRLRRGPKEGQMMPMAPMPTMAAPVTPAPAPSAPSAPAAEAAAPADDANTTNIVSPMVGTFYDKPKPEADVYVRVGDTVTPDTVVCLIEAMKMFNEIPAGVSGKVVEVLVNNEDAVDVNKPLFKVATS